MQCQEAFVVLLIFVSSLACGHGDDGSDFLNTKQDEVQTIAQAAEDNYLHTCELVGTCQTTQNCSRLECYPTAEQSSELTCVYVNNNTQCSNSTGSTCNNVEANFVRGYVRTPTLAGTLDFSSIGPSIPNDREVAFGSTICAQRNLDSTFISVNNSLRSNSSLDYFYNLYFGSIDGSFRFYPGRELLTDSCGTYDPRIRPWYTGAISILKDVVVLIDTGTAMQQTGFLDTSTTYVEKTTALVEIFLKTLTVGDRVTVIPVNGSGTVLGQPYSQYNVPKNWVFTDPNFEGLLNYTVNNSAFAGNGGSNGNGAPTNFTDGFVGAASTFAVSSPSSSMQIVILLTNSQSQNIPNSVDLAAADNLTSGATLFVYDLNPNTSVNAGWGKFACEDGEDPQLVSTNPLLFLSSYFSFLARARIVVTSGSLVFWQKPYIDASDLGDVITVAYPAMSDDGLQLIGVAGIDVQLAGLESDPVLTQAVETMLSSSNYGQIAVNPKAGQLSICSTRYNDSSSCGVTPGQTQSLCYPTAQPASDDQLLALLCCPECMKAAKHHYIALSIALGVLGAVLVVLVLLIIYLVRRRKKREGSQRRKSFALQDYSYDTLRKATNNFDKGNIIGKGSFGVVYKACIADQMVAVKQLNQPADRAEDFEAEIKILGITSHPNLVELKGTCFQPTQCFLVYELLESGDLHDRLWPPPLSTGKGTGDIDVGTVKVLTWNMRRIIARGVARGLNYLHCGLEPNGTIFHLDIKPHNILLEYNCNPKIADFGISQLYEPGYTFKVASVVRGTFGYIAPEVLQGQLKPNSKLDVYSYGMVLLQLISGRKIDDPDVRPFLLQWARNYVEDGYVAKVVDEKLIQTVQEEYREALMANCKKLIILAFRCLSERPEVRPEMSDVLETIDTLVEVADDQTLSISDYESDLDNTNDEILPKSGRPIPFSGSKDSDGPFQKVKSESESKPEGITEKNPEISSSLTPTKTVAGGDSHDDNGSSDSKDGSATHGRASVDSSLIRALEIGNVQKEPKLKTSLKRSTSLS